MTSNKTPGLAAAAFLTFLAAGCADSRPASQGQGGSGSDTCVFCHGDVGRIGNLPGTDPNLRASPPAAPAGKPAAVIGAHQAHLNPPVAGSLRGPLPCNECHVVPTSISHATNPPANPVAFGTLAKTQNNSPTWNSATSGCSATYCHGGFNFSGVRGTAATPLWTGSPITCVDCHGLPPTGHPTLTGPVTAATCSACHPATVKADGTIDIAGGKHVNGLAEFEGAHSDPLWADPTHHGYQASAAGLQTCTTCHVAFGAASGVAASSCNTCHTTAGFPTWQTTCIFCHGTAGRTGILPGTDTLLPAAPPVGTQGETAATTVAVGAHQGHLNPATATAIASPVACSVCHPSPLPADVAHVNGLPTAITFSGLATARSAAPVYNRGAAPTCSSTYCHGNFTFGSVVGNTTPSPAWTDGTALTCTSCHGLPPVGHPPLTGAVTAITCNGCHPATVKADGTIDVAGGKHVNGLAEFQGGHSDPLWADPTHHGYQASASGLQACTSCHVGFGTASGVAGSSCNTCHGGAAWQMNCTFCHGTAGRTGILPGTDTLLPAAPPVGTQGETAATTVAVGAHQGHLNPATAAAIASPVACSVCHPSPLPADVTHVNGQPTAITFSGLASTRGAAPVYNRGAAPTCSSTYCHGNFAFGSVVGNTTPSPAWTNGTALTCTSCHGLPPTGHSPAGPMTAAACNQCHPATVKTDGTIEVAGGKHINGASDVTGGHPTGWALRENHGFQTNLTGLTGCKSCHGTDLAGGTSGVSCAACHTTNSFPNWDTNCTFCHGNRTSARQSPPVDIQGRSVATNVSVGRHDKHVGATLMTPIACTECHVARTTSVITDSGHIDGDGIAEVTFGPIARTGGKNPVYTRTSATASGCSATHCHGNFTGGSGSAALSWVSTTAMTCTSCHGNPPTTGEHDKHVNGESLACSVCHGTGYAKTGAATGTVSVSLHVNGAKNIVTGNGIRTWVSPSCTPSDTNACHGSKNW